MSEGTFFSPDNLIAHYQKYIPRVTDLFSNIADVTGEIIDGDPQTLQITDTAHGLSAGRQVVLTGALIDNPISSAAYYSDDGVVRFTTSYAHDLTEDYQSSVTLNGFTDDDFNGDFTLVTVPSRYTFEISADSEPTLNGDEVLRETWETGINGTFEIESVDDDDTYTISLDGLPDFYPQTLPTLSRSSGYNMSVSVDSKRAISHYTAQATDKSKMYLYIIMGDAGASKDSRIKSDATMTNLPNQAYRIKMINTYSVVIFMSTTADAMGAAASELAWNDLLQIMLASGSSISFDDFGNSNFTAQLISHGTGEYSNAYYSHVYDFEYVYEITSDDLFTGNFRETRAFRDIDLSIDDSDVKLEMNLDDETD